jgi:hypothetical protein
MIVNLKQLLQHVGSSSLAVEFQDGDPRKPISFSIEQQKKRAKELLRAAVGGDAKALARIHKFGLTANDALKLSDAQIVIAQESGFRKWTDFKTYVEHAALETRSLAAGMPTALDAGKRTLHIRCGHDIMHKLAVAGFVGDYLPFPDPYVMGPVVRTSSLEEFIEIRAQFLSRWTGSPELARSRLQSEYGALKQAKSYERVMLWFEHDSYDQLTFARLLAFFQEPDNRPQELNFVSITGFPGTEIFNGLGQLPPEALRMLWQKFSLVSDEQLRLGTKVWEALTEPSPLDLFHLAEKETPVLPTMAPALWRHLQELPSVKNGLSLTEQLIIQILREKGSMTAARLFGWYTNHYEPLTYLGDTMFYDILQGLAVPKSPAVKIQKAALEPTTWNVSLTDIGNEILSGERDWLKIGEVDRWVGGVHIQSGREAWRIDGDLRPVLQ